MHPNQMQGQDGPVGSCMPVFLPVASRNSILYKLKNLVPEYMILNVRLDLIISDY